MSGLRRARRPSHGPVAIASSPWIVVLAGVVVMVVLLIVALGAYRGRSPAPDAGSAPPALPLPQVPPPPSGEPTPTPTGSSAPALLPGLSPRASGLPSSIPAGSRAATTSGPTVGSTPTRALTRGPQGSSAVSGRYRVVQSFDGGFIGEVLIVNASDAHRGWTVRFTFSGGRLVTTWVEGAPQGTVRQFDGGFTYASGVDVAPGRSATLRFHLERASTTPQGCTVDGVRCSGF
ncbi:cellulose binding domain-containing protein [Micromonospora sp. STR1_7]|uniref:Cellulose binding domain-containing protein n=1 Tax=Micromonospora parastrephiae TaxID=2806101 RepID=A0ABS1XUW2_9ACTN|nr:cellulose binding domain-containing protein [Micromonospora parastrephiae]MBM0233044.1 cellulose binding domain-containing protein [Micromonospora parastrephiae]